jgi:acylpyruvate hydrolase
MRLATVRTRRGTTAVRIDGDDAVELGVPDVGVLLRRADWAGYAAEREGVRHPVSALDYAPLVTAPEKVICVGLNYRTHIREMGHEMPQYPTLFAKYSRAFVGAHDDVVLPAASQAMDWEAELGVVVGAQIRHADVAAARRAIAGFTVINDVTARDWQYRTPQWLQGKTFEDTTPIGPWLVTDHAQDDHASFALSCTVDGKEVQRADTGDLVFDPATLLSYISTVITLVPGDVIATGTPGGVGHARKPPEYLAAGAVLTTRIEGVGECRNTCRVAAP